jgi:protease I
MGKAGADGNPSGGHETPRHVRKRGWDMPTLSGVRIAFVVANEGVESVELTTPWGIAREHDASTFLVAPKEGPVELMDHLDKAGVVDADLATADARVPDFDAVVLPGGVANPDQLRMDAPAVAFVRSMIEAGKPLAAICHAPWTLVEAGVLRGRTLTSWPSLQTDIRNAGGIWVDEQVVRCTDGPNTMISSRSPADLPAFCEMFLAVFSEHQKTVMRDDARVDEAGMESFPASDPASFTSR